MHWKIIYFFTPLVLMIFGNTIIYGLVLSKIESRDVKIAMSAFLGLLLFAGLLLLIPVLAEKAGLPIPKFGNFKSIWIGLTIGVVVSGISGYFYAATNSKKIDWSIFKSQAPYSSVAAVSPATVEEATFRYGIVHGAAFLGGSVIGYAAGSIPFGLGHLIDRLTGKTVSLEQAFGIVIAGLLLSALYLNYGIWAAIGCHWAWNSLASCWVKSMALNNSSGMSDYEGAYTTSLTLLIAFLIVIGLAYSSTQMKAN